MLISSGFSAGGDYVFQVKNNDWQNIKKEGGTGVLPRQPVI